MKDFGLLLCAIVATICLYTVAYMLLGLFLAIAFNMVGADWGFPTMSWLQGSVIVAVLNVGYNVITRL